MNLPTVSELRTTTDELRTELATTTEGVTGVVRLEPSLRNALRRLWTGTTVLSNGRRVRSAADGIELHRRDDVVDVHVDVVTDLSRPAAATARDIRHALGGVLVERGLTVGSVTVAVLSIEH